MAHAHEILKKSSYKVSIHFSSSNIDVSLVTIAHLYEYEKIIYIIDNHGKYKKT